MSSNKSKLEQAAKHADIDNFHQAEISKGFCVKEFDQQLQSLRKENFNLKLRIFLLESKNPCVRSDVKTIHQQNLNLMTANKNLSQEVAEKQDLLCQALKAIEIIEQEKTNNEREMKKTVAFLTHKVATLQQAFQRQGTSTEDHCKRQMIELVGRLQDKIQNLKKENETSQSGFLKCSNENFKIFENNELQNPQTPEDKIVKAVESLNESRLKIYFIERDIQENFKSGMNHEDARKSLSALGEILKSLKK